MDQIVGIIKEIDALGRIVIPKESRQCLMIEKEVEVILTKDGILIRNSKFQLTEKK